MLNWTNLDMNPGKVQLGETFEVKNGMEWREPIANPIHLFIDI
jgi:hypothetical protein